MRVAISGAGVGGPTLAHWLLRGGHEPILIERAPAFRTGGYVIDFWGPGYEVARRMGLEAAVLDAGYRMRAVQSVGARGELLASVRTEAFYAIANEKFTSIQRGDLAATVYGTVADRIETIFGDSIAAIEEHDDGVGLSLAGGGEREVDLVIGADGLHSNVRRLAFGPDADYAKYLGCRVAACMVDGYRPRDELIFVTRNVPGRQLGRFTLREDRTLFLFIYRSDEDSITDDPAQQKAELRHEFADVGWETPRVLDALDKVDDLYFDAVSQIHLPRWSDGRVALVGDAAACVSLLAGEGTGLAMTEAYVLAGELARAKGDHRTAFSTYERRLRPLLVRKQAAANRFISFFATRTRLGLWMRNIGMRAMNLGPFFRSTVGWSLRDDFDLPDYRL